MEQQIQILEDRLAKVMQLDLASGGHDVDSDRFCVMEAVAFVAGEPWTDSPQGDGQPDLQFPNGGYTGPDALLMVAAPDLLALARKYASECAECEGTGLVSVKTFPGGIEVDNDDQPCEACADMRAVIAKATQP